MPVNLPSRGYQPHRGNWPAAAPPLPKRAIWPALRRGLLGRCPNCGEGRLFGRFLKVAPLCRACGEQYHHQRADDAPPYITMVLVGHILVPTILAVETAAHPSALLQMMIFLPATLAMTLLLLQPVKGAVVALQWALYMHGFNPCEPDSPIVGSSGPGPD